MPLLLRRILWLRPLLLFIGLSVFLSIIVVTLIEMFKERILPAGLVNADFLEAIFVINSVLFSFLIALLNYLLIIAEKNSAIKAEKLAAAYLLSEEKFRLVFDHLNDAIFLYLLGSNNEPGNFIEVNEEACRRLGYSKDEFFKMSPLQIEQPESANKKFPIIFADLTTVGKTSYEAKQISKNGQLIPVEVSLSVAVINNERVIISSARDISLRKEQEIRNQETSEELRSLNNFLVKRELKMMELKAQLAGKS